MERISDIGQPDLSRTIVDSHLQFSFFLSSENEIYSCDNAGREFWDWAGADVILPHIEFLKFNTAVSNTTIIVNNNSYNMRLIPINNEKGDHELDTEYIVVLQNKTLFSSLVQSLSAASFPRNIDALDKIFDRVDNGIFLVDTYNIVMYVNRQYEAITGLSRESLIGQNIYELEEKGILSTLISPSIMETYDDFTAFQVLNSGKHAIISGSIVCNNKGDSVCTLTCPNIITNPQMSSVNKRMLACSISQSKTQKNFFQAQIDIIAESDEMRAAISDILRVAHYDVPVLLLGESGTGKEVMAALLHNSSRRRYGKFVKINCSALTSSLLETELFGYEPGSFTGALAKGKRGLFEEANNGTILLDEIGDMPLESQAKLLRVLEEGEIYKVGGVTPVKVNARIIAATNHDLEEMVEQHSFRRDLYHRLNVIPVSIPPLRNRRSDVIPLILHYSYYFNKKYGMNKVFSPELLNVLSKYSWPGNIRELRNIVDRLTLICTNVTLTPEQFFAKCPNAQIAVEESDPSIVVHGIIPLKEAEFSMEMQLISRALKKGGSTRKAAKLLGVSQSTIIRKMERLHLDAENWE